MDMSLYMGGDPEEVVQWAFSPPWYSKHSGNRNSGSQANLIAFNNVTKKVVDTINVIAMDDISVAQPAALGVSRTIGVTMMDLGC